MPVQWVNLLYSLSHVGANKHKDKLSIIHHKYNSMGLVLF